MWEKGGGVSIGGIGPYSLGLAGLGFRFLLVRVKKVSCFRRVLADMFAPLLARFFKSIALPSSLEWKAQKTPDSNFLSLRFPFPMVEWCLSHSSFLTESGSESGTPRHAKPRPTPVSLGDNPL